MKLVIVTGMSGAGKGTAVKIMEDMGYYCVDNLPIPLVEQFVDFTLQSEDELEKVAVSIDIRNSNALSELEEVLERIRQKGIRFEILFLEAEDSVLVKRYKETRRSHPLAGGGRIDKGIGLERKKLAFLKEQADYIIDTSRLLQRELKTELERIFIKNEDYRNLYITGNDIEIQDFVMQYKEAHEFLDKLEDMIKFLIPNYVTEGKTQLVISIGCTGGKHRSVTLANELYDRLKECSGYGIKIEHRDIGKDALRGK